MRVLASLLAVAALFPAAARAEIWLPLEHGSYWSYAGATASETRTVEGRAMVRDRPVTSILYSPSTDNPGLRNYWSTGADGDVLLHGFGRPGEFGFAYDPPIVLLDAPPSVGKTWQQAVDVYDLASGDLIDSWVLGFQITEELDLEVPAGSFHTFGVGAFEPALLLADGTTVGLDGTSRSAVRGGTARYFARDVGIVRELGLDLVEYAAPTPVTPASWAGVKALYR